MLDREFQIWLRSRFRQSTASTYLSDLQRVARRYSGLHDSCLRGQSDTIISLIKKTGETRENKSCNFEIQAIRAYIRFLGDFMSLPAKSVCDEDSIDCTTNSNSPDMAQHGMNRPQDITDILDNPEVINQFRSIFQKPDSPVARGKYLSRLFGIFSEQIVRIWANDPRSPYEDIGRPTLRNDSEKKGYTLDFTLRNKETSKIYVAELKCEIEYRNYRYFVLSEVKQLDHHTKRSFRAFLDVASGSQIWYTFVNVEFPRKS